MQRSLNFKIKDNVDIDKHKLVEIFFKNWVDTTCNNQVQYKIEKVLNLDEVFRVDFEKQEDATVIRLTGIPKEFQDYLELIIEE